MPRKNSRKAASKDLKRICLGIPFDLFLDRDENKLIVHEQAVKTRKSDYGMKGGLSLPNEKSAGTGNIIIRGRPGTGKSILAMQIAQKCCEMNGNQFFSWFIALEESPDRVRQKSESFGWDAYFHTICNLNEFDQLTNPEEYGEILLRILTKQPSMDNEAKGCNDSKCTIEKDMNPDGTGVKHFPHSVDDARSRVYVSRLSPRHLTSAEDSGRDVFDERFKQLENLLCGAKWLKSNKSNPPCPWLAMICIDSLNVFGDRLLTREQLYRLFDLFKTNNVIGIFILEEDEGEAIAPDSRLHGDMIEFLADVVIALQYGEDEGYFVRYFEIVKSRYQHQIYGKHPFKIVKCPKTNKTGEENPNMPVEYGVVIYPSLHYIVYGTEPESSGSK